MQAASPRCGWRGPKKASWSISKQNGVARRFLVQLLGADGLAAAVNFLSEFYGWSQREFKPAPSDHLKASVIEDLAGAAEVLSLSTFGAPTGVLVRFAIGRRGGLVG
jgi:hypothetical protein